MKTCTKCLVEKSSEKFYPTKTTQHCKKCIKEAANAKNKIVRTMFGKGDTRQVLKANAPVGAPCECCGKPMSAPNFDHCHKTNTFRGWLCMECNTSIGKLGDTLEGVMNAVRYLS